MGYRIVYTPDMDIQKRNICGARLRLMIAGSFLILAWMVCLIWPEGRAVLAVHLMPGEPTLTQAAFSNLLENLRNGDRMVDSLTVFCREILHEII